MIFYTLDLSILTCSSTRLAHGATCSSIFKLVPMLTHNLLTFSPVLALEPYVIKASGAPMSLENNFMNKSTSDSFFNRQIQMEPLSVTNSWQQVF